MRLQKIHPITAVLLILVTALLAWANLRRTRWPEFDVLGTPANLDPVTRYFFFRGWPLSPFMVCPIHGMRFHPEEGPVLLVLVLDFFVACLILAATAAPSEWLARRHWKFQPITAVLLIGVAFLLLGANFRTSVGWDDVGADTPPELDPVARYFFSRGWPLSPWWVCTRHSNRFYPEHSPIHRVLVLNGIVAHMCLVMTAALSEWLAWRLRRLKAADTKLDPQSP